MTEASHHKDEALRSSAALKKRRERHATWLMYFGLLSLLVGVLMFVLPLFSEGEQRQGWLMRLSEPFQSILRKLAEGPPPPTNDPEKQSERSLEITRERAREREMAEREMRSSERRIGRERRDLLGEKRADLQEDILDTASD